MEESVEDDGALHMLCEILGVFVICLCTIMKVPQIIKIIRAGTTQGINIKSLLMEFWCFSVVMAHPISMGYPITAYLELVLLSLQDVILLVMVLNDRKMLTVGSYIIFVSYLALIFGMAMSWLPSWVLYILSSTTTPMSVCGKMMQIFSIVNVKDAGTVSPLTWAIGTFTASARVLTGYVQTKDMFLVLYATQAAVLNSVICACSIIYKSKLKTM